MQQLYDGEIDRILVKQLDELYFKGELSSEGSALLAAVGWKVPRLARQGKSQIPRAVASQRGFARMAPVHSRLPTPKIIAYGIAMVLLAEGEAAVGTGVLLGFHCYLRPGVIAKMLWRHWSRPQGLRAGGVRGWILSLAPQEEEIPTKTGQFDECVELDLVEHEFLNHYLKTHMSSMPEEEKDKPVVQMRTRRSLPRAVHDAGVQLGLDPLNTLHQLRHGGASHDAATKQRTIPEIKDRGTWESDKSVRRYRKPGFTNERIARFASSAREFCIHATEKVPDVLSGHSSPLPKPSRPRPRARRGT